MTRRYDWRVLSRIIAGFQIFCAIIALLVVLYLAAVLGVVTREQSIGSSPSPHPPSDLDRLREEKEEKETFYLYHFTTYSYESIDTKWDYFAKAWLLHTILLVSIVIELWAGVMLLLATDKNRDPMEAQAKARMWEITTTVFLVLDFFDSMIVSKAYTKFNARLVFALVIAVVRLPFLYVVSRFVEEREELTKLPV